MGSSDDATMTRVAASDEEIAVRAYTLWEQRGSPIGSPDEDWFRAEEELRSGRTLAEDAEIPAAKARSASA